MIHGGLQIDLKKSPTATYINHCCLRPNDLVNSTLFWQDPKLVPLRDRNNSNEWDPGCWTCQGNEAAGRTSFRTGLLEQFGTKTNLSGPQVLDLMFDIGCNLACRTCGPHSSTFWQKHLTDNNIKFSNVPTVETQVDRMIDILKNLDLSNLEQVIFCGGETLLGQGYWRVADAIADMMPNAKDKLTISFQTNGTQPINKRNYDIIEKVKTVRLNISLDGIGEQFEYLRWPANWDQVSNNILNIKDTAPPNLMLLIEETLSIFNLVYTNRLADWISTNFQTDSRGDAIVHTQHVAHGIFSLDGITQEYFDALNTDTKKLLPTTWVERPYRIKGILAEINKFDAIRNQEWTQTFPEVAQFYNRFINSGVQPRNSTLF